MDIEFIRSQELAAVQLHAISTLLQPARTSFIALYALSAGRTVGVVEPSAMSAALNLAKTVLKLEYDLRRTLADH